MTGWVLLAVLGAGDWDCDYGGQWSHAGLEPPCHVLVGTPEAQLQAAQERWQLTLEEARCALEAAEPLRRTPEERARLKTLPDEQRYAAHFAWRRCAVRWPAQAKFWRAAVLSWNGRTPFGAFFERLPPAPADGGRPLADELLDLDTTPSTELARWLVRADQRRLLPLLRDPRVSEEARFELALAALDAGPTDQQWGALVEPLLEAPLAHGHWLFAAEQWLRLPEAVRARAGAEGGVVLRHDGDLRPALVLGLVALGKLDEARRIALAPLKTDDADARLCAEAARWAVSGERAGSPWDAAIDARDTRSLGGWETWDAMQPFLHPHEALIVDLLRRREARDTREPRGDDDFTPPVSERLQASAVRSRERLRARVPFEQRTEVVEPAAPLPDALPSPFVERTEPWKGAAAKPVATAKLTPKLPGSFWAVRAERQGRRTVVLALSQRLDPVGEVGPGGYWLLVSTDGGRWEELYLSLGDHHPFHALATSTVPLLGADDVVRLAMEDAPLDERTVSFPPLTLSAPTKRALVVLEAPLAALRKDTDGDGLRDLVEARLLLDPRNRDTDGDGVGDGDDPTPRLDDRLSTTTRAEMLNAFFEHFLTGRSAPRALVVGPNKKGLSAARGRSRSADLDDVRFLLGAAKELGGLRPLVRLINLAPAELEAAHARFGTFYPMHLELMMDGADHGYLEWGESWRGGSVRIDRRADGRLEVTPLSSWVT